MNWVSGKPTEAGFYFCMCEIVVGISYMAVVKVYGSFRDRPLEMTTVFWDGGNFSIGDTRFIRWSERIQEPPL
jgi:hypothetical protein